MSKPAKCATCGRPLSGQNFHYMWDGRQKKTVKVCRDDRTCQDPYLILKKEA